MANQVFVTGGAGFIGSHTIVELIEAGYEPVVIDNFSNSKPDVLNNLKKITGREIKFYEGDCNDFGLVDKIFAENQIQGIIHFAAYKAVGESVSEPVKYYENNINSLLVLLKVMEKHQVKNLVFSSSCTVYGQPDELPVTEQSPKKPAESPYGNTKQICEEIIEDSVKSQKFELKALALRYFNPVGAHASALIGELPLGVPNNLIPFVTQTAAGIRDKLTVFGDDYNTPDGTCIRDYIHVVDLAKAHVKALEYLAVQNEASLFDIFNVGTGKGNSVLEVIRKFEKVNGVKLNYTIGARRPGDVEQTYGNVDKANRLMNWKAELGLEDALRDAWRWQQMITQESNK
jgi:UDP-glucose 4-epimerase